jgi:ComF family protein
MGQRIVSERDRGKCRFSVAPDAALPYHASMRAAGKILDVLFPPRCPACARHLASRSVCSSCLAALAFIQSPLCPICGLPFAGAGRDHRCTHCLARPPQYDSARACVGYETSSERPSTIAAIVHRYKYARDVTLAPILGELLADRYRARSGHDLIVPVPLHISRLRWRGFNQALLLAKPLARKTKAPLAPFALRRTRPTRPQVGLDEPGRRRNIARAFDVRHPEQVRSRSILLVDDVYTTGATVNECARMLRRAGAERVDVFVLARAVPHSLS